VNHLFGWQSPASHQADHVARAVIGVAQAKDQVVAALARFELLNGTPALVEEGFFVRMSNGRVHLSMHNSEQDVLRKVFGTLCGTARTGLCSGSSCPQPLKVASDTVLALNFDGDEICSAQLFINDQFSAEALSECQLPVSVNSEVCELPDVAMVDQRLRCMGQRRWMSRTFSSITPAPILLLTENAAVNSIFPMEQSASAPQL